MAREINKVQMVIHEFGAEICDILPSAEECQKWLKDFHDGLIYRIKGKSKFADRLLEEAQNFVNQQAEFAKKRWKKTQSTTAAGESAEKLVTPLIGGSAASAPQVVAARAGGNPDFPPKVSESSDAANRCFASPAEGASGKRSPHKAEGSAARSLQPTTAELYDFAEAARLNEADAREWWELCTERGWKDRYGKPIRDWKKACERYCARRAINRMANGET